MPANKIKIEPALTRRYKKQTAKKNKGKKISCKILIVCEGEKTEPNYFRSFENLSNGSLIYEIVIEGGGIRSDERRVGREGLSECMWEW